MLLPNFFWRIEASLRESQVPTKAWVAQLPVYTPYDDLSSACSGTYSSASAAQYSLAAEDEVARIGTVPSVASFGGEETRYTFHHVEATEALFSAAYLNSMLYSYT